MKVRYKVREKTQYSYEWNGKTYKPGMQVRFKSGGAIATIKYVPGMKEMRDYYMKHDSDREGPYEWFHHIIVITGGDFTTRNNGYGWNVKVDEIEIL